MVFCFFSCVFTGFGWACWVLLGVGGSFDLVPVFEWTYMNRQSKGELRGIVRQTCIRPDPRSTETSGRHSYRTGKDQEPVHWTVIKSLSNLQVLSYTPKVHQTPFYALLSSPAPSSHLVPTRRGLRLVVARLGSSSSSIAAGHTLDDCSVQNVCTCPFPCRERRAPVHATTQDSSLNPQISVPRIRSTMYQSRQYTFDLS